MRYTKTHKEETRRRLLDSSRAMVKKDGFDATGVDALMAAIGLTSGAFYSHFPSKLDLLQAVIDEEVAHSIALLDGDAEGGLAAARKKVGKYLSDAHALHPEAGCVLPALGAEIGRSEEAVKAVVEGGLKRIHESWRLQLDDADGAWALMAQCVGALILARAVKTARTRGEILGANKRQLEARLGGESARR